MKMETVIRFIRPSRFLEKTFLFPLLVLSFFVVNIFSSVASVNSDFETANTFYKQREYQKAIVVYQKIVDAGTESPEVFFNLGNCYFKCDSNAKAILYYERAKKLAPTDEDILFNLKIANQRNTDKINAVPTLFINTWWTAFKSSKTVDGWAWLCVMCVLVSFLLFATFKTFKTSMTKKIGFWGGSFFIILALVTFLLADIQNSSSEKNKDAIIMVDAVSVKSSPEEKGKEIFILHSGTYLQVINTEGSWSEIRLPDNNVGWLPSTTIDLI